MAINAALRIFRLCPAHRKPGGSLRDLAPREVRPYEPPERSPFGADAGGRCE
jgi:hypothetical protein